MSTGSAKLAAAAVHLLTASGAAVGLLALVAIGAGRYKAALAWMLVALVIDSLDGPLARGLRTASLLPSIDGALLDNLVDYLNYVVVPAFLLHRAVPLPDRWATVAASLICVASAFQFAQTEAKTRDHYFRGFPSYWNVVLFYLLLLGLPPWGNLAIVLALCAAVFVPLRYVYPNRTPSLRGLTLTLTALWMACLLVLLAQYPDARPGLVYASLLYGIYYFGLSLWLGARAARRA